MKQKIIKSKLLRIFILVGLFTCFFSCEKEDINSYENNNSLKISSRKATVNEVLHKINNSSIKQKIVYENNRIIGKNNDISANQNLRINSQDSIFIVIEKENDFTTYLLPISSYTTENPFFLKYIITVDVNNIERSGYIKYIPSTPTGNLNLGTFSGIVEVYNIEEELIGLTTFVNGTVQPQTSNSHNRVICYDQVTINEVTCSHGGGHGVGESCTEGFINDAYWYVSITTVCNYDPTTIVQIIDDSSNPSMGGGSSNLNPNTSTLNKIIDNLTMAQLDWWYSQNTSQATKDAIVNYVNQNNTNEDDFNEAMEFVKELIDLASNEEDQELATNLINLSIVTKQNGYFENSFDSNYYNLINPYTEVDTQMYNPQWLVYFSIQCAVARARLSQEPGWNDLYEFQQDVWVYWEASKEMLHIGLDLIGLAPVVGEIADLTNGVIYTIEGEGVNATLSFASTIPVAGWFSAGIKFAKRSDGLVFTVKAANTLIDFGAYNSKKFRAACGIATGDATKQAHHIIPRGTQIIEHEVVQRAAKATVNEGFHIDQALNGIAVATWRNQPNHNAYNNLIKTKLDDYLDNFPNATPQQCYTKLVQIINQGKQAILNNPNTHINNITF